MATRLDELLEVLSEIIEILDEDREEHWSGWMAQSRHRLLDSDYSGIEHLLSAYGGMGSFNDFVLGQSYENGQFRWKEGHVDKNNRLDELRRKAWKLADEITRDHLNTD